MKSDRTEVWTGEELSGEDAQRRLFELSTLYEVARHLLGAREERDLATRLVFSAMGSLGARSGVMLFSRGQGTLEASHAAGATDARAGETLEISDRGAEFAMSAGVLDLTAAESTGLGAARRALLESFDGALVAAVGDADGLHGLLVLGPRLIPGDYAGSDRELLGAFAGLALRALTAGGGTVNLKTETSRKTVTKVSERVEQLRRRFPPLSGIIGSSRAVLETYDDLLAASPAECTVLLLGESGVGKELAARALHELSPRTSGPFEALNCGSIPSELVESELFGHVRGAFTGAARDRRGAFELANHGTLFLDEIGEMPVQAQTRLLRVLQEGRFRRVGDERTLDVDVRVVAATNRDLQQYVQQHRFREDLYYRVNVFPIRIPPLRERAEDVPELLMYFLEKRGEELGRDGFRVDRDVVESLAMCPFPGNVRELGNLASALAVSARHDERITMEHLNRVWRRQHSGQPPPWEGAPPSSRQDLGSWVLSQARAHRFNLVEAARRLRREQQRSGGRQAVPLCERSALSYYLQGEMLRALAACEGDCRAAAKKLAGDEDLIPSVAKRLDKLVEQVRAARADGGGSDGLTRHFAKLPQPYHPTLAEVARLLT